MIIVEGSDCVGKTTLAQKLVSHLNDLGWPHQYQHFTRLHECWRTELVSNYRRFMNPYVVMDRFIMSEPVYKAISGERPWISSSDYMHLDRLLRNFCSHTIIVAPQDASVIRERYAQNPKREMYSIDKVIAANKMFCDIAARPIWTCPTSDRNYQIAYDVRIDHGSPSVAECALRAYTIRLKKEFPYPGAVLHG